MTRFRFRTLLERSHGAPFLWLRGFWSRTAVLDQNPRSHRSQRRGTRPARTPTAADAAALAAPHILHRRRASSCAALLLAAAAAAALPPAPAGDAGPYRVVVVQMSHNRKVTVSFAPGEADSKRIRSARGVNLQLGVYAREKGKAPGIAAFQITGVTAGTDARPLRLPFYGGMLELPDESALVRAYVYASGIPAAATELRSLEGQIIAYDRSGPVEIDLPLESGAPVTAQFEEVKATLRDLSARPGTASATIAVEAPGNTTLTSTSGEGGYGVSLLNQDRRPARVAGGSARNLRPNLIEYRLSFEGIEGTPTLLRLRVLRRGGTRRVFPFRVEHIPVPLRATGS